jgi:hypothetical protein
MAEYASLPQRPSSVQGEDVKGLRSAINQDKGA